MSREFGIAEGLAITQGIRALQHDAMIREKEQEDKDIFAAADLMAERKKYEADPEKVRQIDTQINGYHPRTRIKAAGQFAALQRNNDEAMKAGFQQDYQDAMQKYKSAKAMMEQGRDEDAMGVMGDVLTKNIKDGYKHEYVKQKDGSFEHIIYKPDGELLQRGPVKQDDVFRQFENMMSRPDNAFQAYANGTVERVKYNSEQMNNLREFRGKDGKIYYMAGQVEPKSGEYKEVWFDQDSNPIERPDAKENLKPRETIEKQEKAGRDKTKDELDITSKRLGIEINRENLKQEKQSTERGLKLKDEDKETDKKRFEAEIQEDVSSEYFKDGYEVDEKKKVVYKQKVDSRGNPMTDLNDKPLMVIDKEATAKYREDLDKAEQFARKNKKAGETPLDAARRLRGEARDSQQNAATSKRQAKRADQMDAVKDKGIPAVGQPASSVAPEAPPSSPVEGEAPQESQLTETGKFLNQGLWDILKQVSAKTKGKYQEGLDKRRQE
jgi:hypothetical protein